MEFRLLHLKTLTKKQYNVGIYLKLREGKNLIIFSVLMACIAKKAKIAMKCVCSFRN